MDVVDEIKARLDPVEYIGRAVNLQRAGRNFRGLCPFHNERTPSFYVFPDRGTWRCFGACGEGGDIFTFAQKREGLQFRDALRELADLAGVQLSREGAQRRDRRDHLAAIMSAAVDYYQRCFREAIGEDARDYVYNKRGITEEAVAAFRIGWAPDEWRSLHDYLLGRGYSEADAVAAGLLIEPDSGGQPYDRFRGRIIIPIADERGIYVAMGGRGLGDEQPKYLNSPQTELFDKGRTLFGLHLAGEAARESGSVVVVEGYMDVIGPWQAGFRNVVATMGTALTEHHAKLLRRYGTRIVLAMDPDSAGMAAAERAGELLLGSPEQMGRAARQANAVSLGAGVELRVAQMPPGKDPDEVAREEPETWTGAVDKARPFPEFLLMRLMGDSRPDSPLEARRMVDRLRPILDAVSDPVERAMYVQRVARHLDIPESAVMDRIRRPMQRAPRPRDVPGEARRPVTPEDMLLALILRHPSLRLKVRGLPADLFSSGVNRELFLRWVADESLASDDDEDPAAAHVHWLRGLRLPPYSDEEARKAASQTIHAILKERLLQRQAALSEDVAALERELGANRVAELSEMAWRGTLIPDDAERVAHMVIEDLELGLSLHRREEPRLA